MKWPFGRRPFLQTLITPRNYRGVLIAAAVFAGAKVTLHLPATPAEAASLLPFSMSEVSLQTGISNHHQEFSRSNGVSKPVGKFIFSTSASVAVFDYDNDGWPDVFVNNAAVGSVNHLFHNNHDGTFSDVTEKAGLGMPNPDELTTVVAFDFDNDGFKDLILMYHHIRVFRNNGNGTFSEVTDKMGLPDRLPRSVPAVIDFNNDGYLDLIFAARWSPGFFNKDKNLEYLPNSLVDATNGGPVYVYENLHGHGFRRVPGDLGLNSLGFFRSVGTYDIRGTGRADVWLANDFAADKLYLNEGAGVFRDVSKNIEANTYSRNGMNTEFADLDNDGHPVVFVSQIFEPGERIGGNTLWKWVAGDRFQEISRERGVNRCGWAWAGKFVDLDNDGNLDLIVGNGFISQNPKKSYWFSLDVLGAGDRSVTGNIKNWPAIGDSSLSGYQQACVFYNHGHGKFTDITSMTPLNGDLSDERAIVTIDYLNNGSQSILVANQNQPLKFFRIDQHNDHQWIGFHLMGTRSNRDAVGAEMKVELEDGRILTRQVQPRNTFAGQSDDRVHFGLGSNPKIKTVALLWPSGQKQEFPSDQVKIGAYNELVEPK